MLSARNADDVVNQPIVRLAGVFQAASNMRLFEVIRNDEATAILSQIMSPVFADVDVVEVWSAAGPDFVSGFAELCGSIRAILTPP